MDPHRNTDFIRSETCSTKSILSSRPAPGFRQLASKQVLGGASKKQVHLCSLQSIRSIMPVDGRLQPGFAIVSALYSQQLARYNTSASLLRCIPLSLSTSANSYQSPVGCTFGESSCMCGGFFAHLSTPPRCIAHCCSGDVQA